jgi:hypothetical protein
MENVPPAPVNGDRDRRQIVALWNSEGFSRETPPTPNMKECSGPAARVGQCCRGVIITPQPLDNTGLRGAARSQCEVALGADTGRSAGDTGTGALVTGAGPSAGRRDDTHQQQVVVVWTVVWVVRAVRDRMGSSGCTSRTGSNSTSPHDQSVENTTRRGREGSKARLKRPANTRGYNVSCFPTGVVNRDRWAVKRQGDVAGLVTRTESQAATKKV